MWLTSSLRSCPALNTGPELRSTITIKSCLLTSRVMASLNDSSIGRDRAFLEQTPTLVRQMLTHFLSFFPLRNRPPVNEDSLRTCTSFIYCNFLFIFILFILMSYVHYLFIYFIIYLYEFDCSKQLCKWTFMPSYIPQLWKCRCPWNAISPFFYVVQNNCANSAFLYASCQWLLLHCGCGNTSLHCGRGNTSLQCGRGNTSLHCGGILMQTMSCGNTSLQINVKTGQLLLKRYNDSNEPT